MNNSRYSNQLIKTDVLVVGSEGAGARAAIEARLNGAEAFIITKGKIAQSGATMTAGADMTVDGKSAHEICGLPGDLKDSPEKYFEDIVTDGLFINNQEVVQEYVEGCPIIVKEMIDWGMKVYGFERVHAETYARGLFTTGRHMVNTLRQKAKQVGVKLIEDAMVTDLLLTDGQIAGAIGINMLTGEILVIEANAVILATGGWQMAYSHTDATYELTGDGHAAAYRSGAELVDMEMVEFAPATVLWPPMYKGNVAPFVFFLMSGLGQLLNNRGERFMEKYDPRLMENSTKEIISRAIAAEVAEGRGSPLGGVYFSWRHLPINIIEDRLKMGAGAGIFAPGGKWTEKGFPDMADLLKRGFAIEGGWSSHFMIGGIRVNGNAETTIPGLYAAGECSGGLWGAARVAAATSQVIVQGRKAAQSALAYIKRHPKLGIKSEQLEELTAKLLAPLERKKGLKPIAVRKEIQRLADEGGGPIRNEKSMARTLQRLKEIRKDVIPNLYVSSTKSRRCNLEWIECVQAENLCHCAELCISSALERKESRGAHYREDFTELNNDDWVKNIILMNKNGEPAVEIKPIVKTKIEPPKGKITYEEGVGIATKSLEK
jgi:succinate dehydrogenase/fumarate reductase flavoprotein subunit